jgi:cytoskeletal protein CcmA (bactofilin family)
MIGKGTVIDGNVQVQNSVRVDGKVRGNVEATDTVVVGKEGEVEGQIQAKHVLMAGRVEGDVTVDGKVFLESSATVLGDIQASRLVVDEGALFDGTCRMKNEKGDLKNRKGDKDDESG